MANRVQQISSQIVAPPNDGLQYMCRVCSNYEVSINVFSELGRILNLEQKIKKCLRLDLTESGPYPNNVCMNCLGKVNISYELHELADATQEKIVEELTRSGRLPIDQSPLTFNGISPNKYSNPVIVPESVKSLTNNNCQMMSRQSILVNSDTAAALHVLPIPVKRSASPDETPSKKERKTVCSACGEWFFKSELAAHTKRVHQAFKLVFGCVNCSANFNSQDELSRHSESCL